MPNFIANLFISKAHRFKLTKKIPHCCSVERFETKTNKQTNSIIGNYFREVDLSDHRTRLALYIIVMLDRTTETYCSVAFV